jgi:hypothetical protein
MKRGLVESAASGSMAARQIVFDLIGARRSPTPATV